MGDERKDPKKYVPAFPEWTQFRPWNWHGSNYDSPAYIAWMRLPSKPVAPSDRAKREKLR